MSGGKQASEKKIEKALDLVRYILKPLDHLVFFHRMFVSVIIQGQFQSCACLSCACLSCAEDSNSVVESYDGRKLDDLGSQ